MKGKAVTESGSAQASGKGGSKGSLSGNAQASGKGGNRIGGGCAASTGSGAGVTGKASGAQTTFKTYVRPTTTA